MKDVNWLVESYLAYLKNKQSNIRISIEDLLKDDRVDEANLEKIRLNIVDIFSKMFNISITNNYETLREKYFIHFDKITKPWLINKLKAEEFEKEQEVIIENIKIQEAEELKSKFVEYYVQIEANQER